MSEGYKAGLTLDRIDNSRNYSKKNCRWISMKEQSNNKRNNLNIEINGEVKTFSQWCDHYKVNYHTAYYRYQHGYKLKNIFQKDKKEEAEEYIKNNCIL